MVKLLKRIFWPPVFGDEEKNRTAGYLNALLWASFLLLLPLRIFAHITEGIETTPEFFTNPITILIGVVGLLIIALRFGFVYPACYILLLAAWAALTYQASLSSGVFDTAFMGIFVIILMAGLLLGSRASIIFAILAILSGWYLAYTQTNNATPLKIDTAINVARDDTVIFILISVISFLTINGLRSALKRSALNEKDLLKSNQQLQDLRADLERRVEERTQELQTRSAELELLSSNSTRRATQLQAVAQVGSAITTIQTLQSLLPRVTGVIGKQFSLYHVGIFLLDDAREFAVLTATNSAGGQKMLARGHRLRIGQGVVGTTAETGMPRIALDTGSDATFFNNPDLPATRSEMAIPLRIGSEIIGILDLQSDRTSEFDAQDIELLSIVADQVAIAIQNARRYQETEKASLEAETLYGESVRKQWVAYTQENGSTGYRYSGTTIQPMEGKVDNSTTRQAILSKAPSSTQGTTSRLAVPIQLRGQVIGLLNIEYPGNRVWDQDEIDITRSIAERASLAIENARLLQDAQNRATKERVIGEIAARLSASNDMNNIFQTAAQELGQVMPDADVVVQFLPEQNDAG